LVQALVAVSALGLMAGIGFTAVDHLVVGTQEAKLERDVTQLNAAVEAYLGGGGSIPIEATASQVIAKLKAELSDSDRDRQVGYGGSYVDARLMPVGATAEAIGAGEKRAIWDAAGQRFLITTEGVDGITGFQLVEPSQAPGTQTESRRAALRFAAADGWVWDYQDAMRGGITGPDQLQGTGLLGGGYGAMNVSPATLALHPPLFSLDGGIYAEEDFDLDLHFSNPNPVGVSEVWYSVDGAPHELYTGDAVVISGESQVVAYSRSLDPDSWVDSQTAAEAYRPDVLLFSGNTAGRFLNPVGDDDMVVSIENSDGVAEMWWGAPYERGGWFEGNYLRFEGLGFENVAAFEEFELGTLTYFNSTTYAGTNATGVDLELMLQILVPDVSAAFTYGFELLSTPNRTSQTADQNADYVWVGDVDGGFSAEIRGYDYTLALRFGEMSEDADGFTTIDTFHVHEGSWASGSVFGTLLRGERSEGAPETPAPIGELPDVQL
jgi:hypothetical protein